MDQVRLWKLFEKLFDRPDSLRQWAVRLESETAVGAFTKDVSWGTSIASAAFDVSETLQRNGALGHEETRAWMRASLLEQFPLRSTDIAAVFGLATPRPDDALADEIAHVDQEGWPRRYALAVMSDDGVSRNFVERSGHLPAFDGPGGAAVPEHNAIDRVAAWLSADARQPTDLLLIGWPTRLEVAAFMESPLGALLEGAPIGGFVVWPASEPLPQRLWVAAQDAALGPAPSWRASWKALELDGVRGIALRPRGTRPEDRQQQRDADRAAAELRRCGPELCRELAEILSDEPTPERLADRLILCDLDETLDVIDHLTGVVREQSEDRVQEVRRSLRRVLDYTLPHAKSLEASVQRVRDALGAAGRVELPLAGTAVLEMVMARHDVRRTRYVARPHPPLAGESALLQSAILLDASVPLPADERTYVDALSQVLQRELGLGNYVDLPTRLEWIQHALKRAARPMSDKPAWYLIYEDSRSDATLGHEHAWGFLCDVVQRHVSALRLIRLTASGSDAEKEMQMQITLALQELHAEGR